MTKIERAIKGIELCCNHTAAEACAECPYDRYYPKCLSFKENEILEILKEFTPHVLELEEVMKHYSLPPVFVDDLDMQDDYLQDIQPLYFEFQPDRPWNAHWLNYDQVANIREGIKTTYGTIIRAWSAKPTDEQRKAVKWDE